MRFASSSSLATVAALGLSLFLAAGCSDDAAGPTPSSPDDDAETETSPTFGSWSLLVEEAWTVAPGSETYRCVIAEVPYDVSVVGFRPVAPLGTHHTVLTRGIPASNPSKSYECDGNTNAPFMIYGSGVGTTPLTFPEGVAINLTKGEKIMLNLHLFNVDSEPLEGRSGIEMLAADPATVDEIADVVLAGPISSLLVPPGKSVNTGYCTSKEDATVFAVFPHMHQLGTHMTVTAETADGDIVMMDSDYTFDDQTYSKLTPSVALKKGERVRVECTYDNPTQIPRYWGDSTLDEMCLAGIYRYPRNLADNVVCSDRPAKKEDIDPSECGATSIDGGGDEECASCVKSRCCAVVEACEAFPACAEVAACRTEHAAACGGSATSWEAFYGCLEGECGSLPAEGLPGDQAIVECLLGSCTSECGL